MKYLAAVKVPGVKRNEIFEFETKKDRDCFCKEVEILGGEWLKSEVSDE